jgi:hypothetical protein
MSVSGSTEEYGLNYAERTIVPIQPDLLLISYGHNDGPDTMRFRWGIQSLVQTVAAGSPRTEIGLIAQNPQTGNNYQQARAAELALLADQLDLAFVDVLGAFEATGDPNAYLRDGIHPTPGASYLWENTVFASMGAGAARPGPVRRVGAVTRPVSLIRFGDFSRFVKGTPAGWTLKNTRPVVDFQAAEPPHRFAVRFTEQMSGVAYLYQPFNIKLVRGRWVTVAVRLYVPPEPRSRRSDGRRSRQPHRRPGHDTARQRRHSARPVLLADREPEDRPDRHQRGRRRVCRIEPTDSGHPEHHLRPAGAGRARRSPTRRRRVNRRPA